MTRRMVGAVRNPRTNVLGHCTGRLVTGNRGTRPQSQFDAKAVFEACAEHDVAVEINSRPERRDPPTKLLELARDIGCLFSIDSDAHAPGQLDFQVYGCERAEAGRHRRRPDRQHLAAGAPPGLGERVGSGHVARRPEVEVRRSKRRRRTVSAYRDGDRIVVLIPASLTRKEEAEWVETMVARLERSERRRKPTDDDLMQRAAALSDSYLGGLAMPESVRWVDNQQSRWGSCTPGDRTIRLSARLQGMPAWVIDYVLVHELAHLLEARPRRRFWGWVDRYPQAERAKGYLHRLVGRGPARPAAGDGVDDGTSTEAVARQARPARPGPARGRAARRPATSARRATPR